MTFCIFLQAGWGIVITILSGAIKMLLNSARLVGITEAQIGVKVSLRGSAPPRGYHA